MPTLSSKRVLIDGRLQPATIHFADRKITQIERGGQAPRLSDHVIMAGIVDSHVHVNEPGRTEWEGFETATRAAAAGGITTIVDMPLNSIPPTTTVDALYEKAHAMEEKLRVDVGLWGGVIPGNVHELGVMLAEGALGFKCFLVHSGVDEFPNVDERQLREAARELAGTGAPLLVHAELGEHLREPHGDPEKYATYLATRPRAAEDAAIELLARVAEESGARIHIVHLSSASALDILRTSRANLSAETTPHYLHFDAERVPDGRCEFKCAPPIREHENRERLWRGLEEGLIELVVSDHSPCTPHLKGHDFVKAWGGISSVQFVLPVVWTEAQRRGHSIADVARWICEGPARLAGLRNKGSIAAGNDADFVVWSPEESFAAGEALVEHRHKLTPYAGETLRGVVKETWLRGELVYRNGEHVGENRGEWLRRAAPRAG